MATVNEKIKSIKRVIELSESTLSCEKARIPMVKAEALRLFQDIHKQFVAYEDVVNSSQLSSDHDELHVLMAEAAFAVELIQISNTILERYFQRSSQRGQFYCRGKQLMALIIDNLAKSTNGAESIRQRKIALAEILEAMSVATQPENLTRYKFLVYNISITCWSIVNSFLRSGRAKFFVSEMNTVSQALEQCNDPNVKWRIMYLSGAAVCLHDDGQLKPASDLVDKAVNLTERMLAVTVASEQKAGEALKAATVEAEGVLNALRKLEEWEELKRKKPKKDPDLPEDFDYPPIEVPPLEGMALLGFDELKMRLDESQSKKTVAEATMKECLNTKVDYQEQLGRLFMQRVHCNPADSKGPLSTPSVSQSLRLKTLVQCQCVSSGCVADKDIPSVLAQCEKELNSAPFTPVIAETLLDLSRAACQVRGESEAAAWTLAYRCIEVVEKSNVTSPVISVKLDLCRAIRTVNTIDESTANKTVGRRLRAKEAEGFSIQSRLNALKVLERIIIMCERLDNSTLMEEICVSIWNTSVPMLQQHLRLQVHNALRLAASSLEAIDSPLSRLRASLHLELAKCEELSDYVAAAKDEAVKALLCDYGAVNDALVSTKFGVIVGKDIELDRDRELDHIIKPLAHAYNIRSSVYDSPSDIEGKVSLILQQVKESTNVRFQNDMLLKATSAMLESIKQMPVELPTQAEVALDISSISREQIKRSLSLISVGDLTPQVPVMDLSELEDVVKLARVAPPPPAEGKAKAPAPAKGKEVVAEAPPPPTVIFCPFSKLTQSRVQIMVSIAKLAHARHNVAALLQAAKFVLSLVFDSEDRFSRELIDSQIEVFYLLAEGLVFRMADPKASKTLKSSGLGTMTLTSSLVGLQSTATDIELDSRALGVTTDDSESNSIKSLIVSSLLHGLKLSQIMKDQYGVQNAIIFFWNLHIHVFRKGLYAQTIPEVFTFVQAAIEAIEATAVVPKEAPAVAGKQPLYIPIPGFTPILQLDERLRIAIIECHAALLSSRGDHSAASEAAAKACAGTAGKISDVYARKKLCEQSCIYFSLASSAAADGAGGKGAKGGGGKAGEPPKFDQPLLSVFSLLTQAESATVGSSGGAAAGAEHSVFACEKAVTMMDAEVAVYLKSLGIPELPQESYDQVAELQAEIWTRVTRLRIMQGNIHGAQQTAERCMSLVTEAIIREHTASLSASSADELNRLSPRVWRWVSVCEKYFGIAISKIIQPAGQELSLQNELRLAALRHFTLGCVYAERAARPDLVVSAAADAWNISIALVDVSTRGVRNSLFALQRQIIDIILRSAPKESSTPPLLQQFYLAVVSQHCSDADWNTALKIIFEAFQYVPASLQKPLWKWRVIVMSKLGKNVLDGIQKLKEDDPSLQARVFAILARSSPVPSVQLNGYTKAVESLASQPAVSPEKMEYLLETVQWMGSAGVSRSEIKAVAQVIVDAMLSLEEQALGLAEPPEVNGGTPGVPSTAKSGSLSQTGSKTSLVKPPSTSTLARKSSVSSVSTANRKAAANGEELPLSLTCQQLEQAARASAMIAVAESLSNRRLEQCMGVVYFLGRFNGVWGEAVAEAHRKILHSKLPPDQQAITPLESFELTEDNRAEVALPSDAVQLMSWAPSAAFATAAEAVKVTNALLLPTLEALPAIPLTCHYILWTATTLDSLGFSLSGLYCLGWLRSVLLFLPSEGVAVGREAALACIQCKAINLLSKCGLGHFCSLLLPTLGLPELSKSVTNVSTFVDYIITLINSAADFAGKAAATSDFVGAAELTDSFGFFTLTSSLGGCIDIDSCAISICEELREMGMTAHARRLALSLRVGFSLRKNSRGLLHTGIILGSLDLLDGKLRECLAISLQSKSELVRSGDPSLLCKELSTLSGAYTLQGELAEALRICEDAIVALQPFVNVSTAVVAATAKAKTASAASVKDRGEGSYEAAAALGTATGIWLECLLIDTMYSIRTGGFGAYNGRVEQVVDSIFSRTESILLGIDAAAGPVNTISAALLSTLSSAVFALLGFIHINCPQAVAIDSYANWLVDGVQRALGFLETCVRIRRELLKCVSAAQRKHVKEIGAGALAASESGAEVDISAISPTVQQQLGLDELVLASQYLNFALMTTAHQPVPYTPTRAQKMSTVEKYLTGTKPAPELVVDRFVASPLLQASVVAASAVQLLVGTGLHEAVAQLMHAVANCLRVSSAGHFDCVWIQAAAPSAVETPHSDEKHAHAKPPDKGHDKAHDKHDKGHDKRGKGHAEPKIEVEASEVVPTRSEQELEALPETPVLSAESIEWRSQLQSATIAAIANCSKCCIQPRAISEGVAALADAYGSANPNNASAWVLALQSFSARDFLLQTWKESLNPSCEVAAALARLIALEQKRLPSVAVQKLIDSEFSFLQTSPAWKRLSVSADPAVILSTSSPASKAVYFCLQFCPRQKYLFCCVGYPAAGPSSGAFSLPGQWCVDKIQLSEETRRKLVDLRQHHAQWRDDAAKLIAVYGDNMGAELDRQGDALESQFSEVKAWRKERALEERISTLLEEMNLIVAPLLSPSSNIAKFVQLQQVTTAPLVLLIDPALQELPWEGLTFVADSFPGAVSRDFSIHMLAHRCAGLVPAPSAAAPPAKGAADASGAVPVISVTAGAVKVLADPFEDDRGNSSKGFERMSIAAVMSRLSTSGAAGAQKWVPVCSNKSSVSVQDWISSSTPAAPVAAPGGKGGVVADPNAGKLFTLMAYVPGKLAGFLPVCDLAVLNLEQVGLFFISDLAHSSNSVLRQNASDNLKAKRELVLESPMKVVALASLAGSGSIVASAWATSLASQTKFVERFWNAFTRQQQSVSAALASSKTVVVEPVPADKLTPTKQPHPEAIGPHPMKRWVKLARIHVGVPNVMYIDA